MSTATPRLRRPRYVSPKELEELYPYSHKVWRKWIRNGLLPSTLKPSGARGRTLVLLSEAHALMRMGVLIRRVVRHVQDKPDVSRP
jgi:hypothetical protein